MTDTLRVALEALEARFKSGNDIPIRRAHITREEFDALRARLAPPAPSGDAVQTSSKADVLSAVGRLADAARRVGGAEAVGNSNAAVCASAEVERIAHEIAAMLAAAPAPAVEHSPRCMSRLKMTATDYCPCNCGATPPAEAREPVGVDSIDSDALGRFAHDEWMDSFAGYPAWGLLDEKTQKAWLNVGARIKRVLALTFAQPRDTPRGSRDADTKRLDYIERTFSGMTNRERYLPVQMIWGKGANGRTLREACDKYMKRDAMQSPTGEPSDG